MEVDAWGHAPLPSSSGEQEKAVKTGVFDIW